MPRIYWEMLNEWFGDNPFGLIIAIIFTYAVYKAIFDGIPLAYTNINKKRKKYRELEEQKIEDEKKEVVEKEKTRNTIHEMNGNIINMDSTIKNTNGELRKLTESVNKHQLNSRIHVDITALTTEKLCEERREVFKDDIEKLEKKVFDGN